MGTKTTIILVIAGITLLQGQLSWAGDLERNQAKRIHDRLTGVSATNTAIDDMEDLLLNDDPTGKSAAEYAIDTAQNPNARYFYNITLKNFAAPWTNEEQTVFTPLNDYSATIVGAVRDSVDFRRILYGNLIYVGQLGGLPPYRVDDNDHYEQLEALGPIAGDLSDTNVLDADTQSNVTGLNGAATAGIMTSRAASMAFFSDGTNRAMFRFTMMNHLCTDLEPLKDITRTPDRVRRDVSRSPGGDSRIFLNGCVGCHAGMDGMAGAFAYYEWNYAGDDKTTGFLDYTPGSVSAKHNINENNFEHGYITIDDSWRNYWRVGPNAVLGNRPGDTTSGWNSAGASLSGVSVDPDLGYSFGNGAKSLGRELANSKAFAQCQVDKVFKAVCLRDPNQFDADRTARDTFVGNFTASNYDMKGVFTDVAAHCKGG